MKCEPVQMFSGNENFENKTPDEMPRRKRGRPRKSAQLASSNKKFARAQGEFDAKIAFKLELKKEIEENDDENGACQTPEPTLLCTNRRRGRPCNSQMRDLMSTTSEVENEFEDNDDPDWTMTPKCRPRRKAALHILRNHQSAVSTVSTACISSGYSSASTRNTTPNLSTARRSNSSRTRHDFEKPTTSRTANETIERDVSDVVDVEDFKRKMIAKWNKTRTRLAEMVRADERRQNETPKGRRTANSNSRASSTVSDSKSSIIDDLYELSRESELGEGHFGMVFRAVERTTRKPVAIKEIRKDRFPNVSENFYARLLRTEVAILQSLNHPAIVGLEAVLETAYSIFIVLEQMDTDLFAVAARRENFCLSEQCAKFFIAQILHALAYLHRHDIAHCDVKPENILLTGLHTNQPQVKLCDFGFARFIGQKCQCANTFGTPVYAAPEIMAREHFDKSVDLWALGVLSFDILAGRLPFPVKESVTEKHVEPLQLFRPQKHWERIGDSAKYFIQQLLQINANKRPTVAECLAHEWLDYGQLYIDLRLLERRVGKGRYLTTVADDEHFVAEYKCLEQYWEMEAEI